MFKFRKCSDREQKPIVTMNNGRLTRRIRGQKARAFKRRYLEYSQAERE
jgi:hypothetical protein